jgi:peptidoglycan hydrolase-like protein with peptidoglycan-binding domain
MHCIDNPYSNIKVAALIDGHTSIDGTWTKDDFAALSVAAADQAGASVREQTRIAAIVGVATTKESAGTAK